ncbi:hypothetical protein SAMN05192553_102700 [Cyclobacterium xiamenense]|uniref:Uncharacterized protein n=1 Tax=Cyclobacterium xiamenense TaxID=1297121 RepID=A0A1H6WKJ6_9BACT|nr:hypothetical protein [Cyclobacterium xiamenense]SEJ16256.1 hypothetical protein SAMN05192553_102700 [Cyclobacterium xiamenense]
MPRIEKVYSLEVGVEQFLNACSPLELKEIELLILSPRFQHRMKESEEYSGPNRPEFPSDRFDLLA